MWDTQTRHTPDRKRRNPVGQPNRAESEPTNMRTVIIGGPRTGKTTRATKEADGGTIIATDSFMGAGGFSDQSEKAAEQLGIGGDWTMEGVTAVRALRKWLKAHPTGKPCDRVIRLSRAVVSQTDGQARLGKGCDTVYLEIESELRRRGVAIE